jgi:hypothetical protein
MEDNVIRKALFKGFKTVDMDGRTDTSLSDNVLVFETFPRLTGDVLSLEILFLAKASRLG